MKKILITAGENQFSKKQIKSLESLIIQNYKTYISHEKVCVIWSRVQMDDVSRNYKKGQPSILVIECHEQLGQDQRVDMFKICTHDWLRITGQSIDQLVISVLETPVFSTLLQRNSKCLSVIGKSKYHLKLVLGLAWSRVSKGYYSFSSSI